MNEAICSSYPSGCCQLGCADAFWCLWCSACYNLLTLSFFFFPLVPLMMDEALDYLEKRQVF